MNQLGEMCTECVEPSVKCAQCVRVDGAGRDVICQCEVSRQISHKSRSKEIIRGGGHNFGGGRQSTSMTLQKSEILEKKGRGEPMKGKQASISHTDIRTFSKIIQQFDGAEGGGKIAHRIPITWEV